jgi:hypothetical protein
MADDISRCCYEGKRAGKSLSGCKTPYRRVAMDACKLWETAIYGKTRTVKQIRSQGYADGPLITDAESEANDTAVRRFA